MGISRKLKLLFEAWGFGHVLVVGSCLAVHDMRASQNYAAVVGTFPHGILGARTGNSS